MIGQTAWDDHATGCACGECQGPAEVALDEHAAPGGSTGAAFAEGYDGTLPSFSLDQIVDDIDNLNTYDGATITYAFPLVETADYAGNGREGTLVGFTPEQAAAMRAVIGMIDDIVDLDFVDAGSDPDAVIRMWNSSLGGTAGGAPTGDSPIAGDVWIYDYTPEEAAGYDLSPGGYEVHLLMHEMGHVLGLSHTSFTQDGDTYAENAGYAENNHAWSMMSYLFAGSAGIDWSTTYSATPMLADVAALQALYGAEMDTRTGDTTYGFNATEAGSVFDFAHMHTAYGGAAAVTIWDAGGSDTIDVSGYGADQVIDLRGGTHSSVGGDEMNLAIAEGAVIENAVGGAGDDDILGQGAANHLVGGAGDDTIRGGGGDDHLVGGGGAGVAEAVLATISDGAGLSLTADLSNATGFTVEFLASFAPDLAAGQWGFDLPGAWYAVFEPATGRFWHNLDGTWRNVTIGTDVVDGDPHRISIAYDATAGTISTYVDGLHAGTIDGAVVPDVPLGAQTAFAFDYEGGIGDLRVWDAALDADAILEGAFAVTDPASDGLALHAGVNAGGGLAVTGGAATLTDGAGTVVHVASDDDLLSGGWGDDVLDGGAGGDRLFGGSGDDVLLGGDGGDRLVGGRGADEIDGGAGVDALHYGASDAAVTVDLGAGTGAGGHAEGDVVSGIEALHGSRYGDALTGGAAGEWILGRGGDDRIEGGGGNDKLTGGAGADTFVFGLDDGRDVIRDFALGEDALLLVGEGSATVRTHDKGARLEWGDTSVILVGVDADALAASLGLDAPFV